MKEALKQCRNPFLSRAGFDMEEEEEEVRV